MGDHALSTHWSVILSIVPIQKSPGPFGPGDYRSGWRDLNPRPLRPERSALPSCATPRCRSSIASPRRNSQTEMKGALEVWSTPHVVRPRGLQKARQPVARLPPMRGGRATETPRDALRCESLRKGRSPGQPRRAATLQCRPEPPTASSPSRRGAKCRSS